MKPDVAQEESPGAATALLEQLARQSPALRHGERKLTVIFSNGTVRRAFVELGPLRPDELEQTLR